MSNRTFRLDAHLLLKAYRMGVFPMAEDASSEGVFLIEPERRGIIPLNHFHIPKSLLKLIRQRPYFITINQDFRRIIDLCAMGGDSGRKTWINRQIKDLYTDLHDMGYAHSVEVRDLETGDLIGGLYGVAIRSAFFGESMFHIKRDMSKVALVHLVARLLHHGYTLLDTQFITDHLQKFGAVEIFKQDYQKLLREALIQESGGVFSSGDEESVISVFLHPKTQTS